MLRDISILDKFNLINPTAGANAGADNRFDTTGIPERIKQEISNQYDQGNDEAKKIQTEIEKKFNEFPEIAKIEAMLNVLSASKTVERIENAYVITTRPKKANEIPTNIIAMIYVTRPENSIEAYLKEVNPSQILTRDELEDRRENPKDQNSLNLYSAIMDQFIQDNVEPVTADAQGLGRIYLGPPKLAEYKPIIPKDSSPNNYIQKFLKISDGLADVKLKTHEIVVSPDLISWKRFSPIYKQSGKRGRAGLVDEFGNPLLDSNAIVNDSVPKLGFELKYGIDDINFFSLWSERLTASAMWDNFKIGLILPNVNDISSNLDLVKNDRKLTWAGPGISSAIDFGVRPIPNSGIFQLSFGYVFGDAEASPYKKRNTNIDEFVENPNDIDYLVRYNGRLHYTFGASIDDDYMFRFGLGGTLYNVERWYYTKNIEDPENPKVKFIERDNETVGGVSGSIEFMRKHATTPYGLGVSYFDESIGMKFWLQIPLPIEDDDTFALRIDARGFFAAFKDSPRAWENKNVFILMPRLIIRL